MQVWRFFKNLTCNIQKKRMIGQPLFSVRRKPYFGKKYIKGSSMSARQLPQE